MSFFGLGVIDFDNDMTDLNRLYGPAGNAPGIAPGGFPIPGIPLFCLIGKIGPSGTPLGIGSSSWNQTMPAGEIYLGTNDGDVSDNQGAWIVLVRVEAASAVSNPAVAPHLTLGLSSPVPNPLSSATSFSFSLPEAGRVQVAVYNVAGQLVRELLAGYVDAGPSSVSWDGRDETGLAVAPGTYFCRVSSGTEEIVKKAVVIR